MAVINESRRMITKVQCRDAGMALVLLLLLISLRRHAFLAPAAMLQVVNMIWPPLFRPFAIVWFGASELIGNVMSRVVITAVFFVVVTPIAVLRRLLCHDSLKLRLFRAGEGSVMIERNHRFAASDLERPF